MMHKIFKLFTLVFLLTSFTTIHAKVYLVSVGITDYPGTSMDLNLPAKDAQTISWLYSKNTDVEYVQLLNEQATMQNITSSMRKTFAKASTDDIVVLFFSGHGYPGGFVAYDGQLTYTQVRKAMATSKCKNKMIFADACFSGKIRTNGNSSQSSLQAAQKANVMLLSAEECRTVSLQHICKKDFEEELMLTEIVLLLLKNSTTTFIKELLSYHVTSNILSCGVSLVTICQ